MNAIDQQFEQPSFDKYAKMESLLIKTLNSQDKFYGKTVQRWR